MDFSLPPVGEGLIEVELGRWLIEPGMAVARGQIIAEVTSDKAAMELPAPFAGTVTELLGEPGDKLTVGATILRYAELGVPIAVPESSGRVAAAPSVRRLARDLGIDLAQVRGSGPDGRILTSDIQPATPLVPKPVTPAGKLKLTGVRKLIAEQMVRAKRAPHFTYVDEFDLSELVRLRVQLKAPFARAGRKLTYLPFIVKAVARALAEIPAVNATFDADAGELSTHSHIAIGVAVAAPTGLVVPVVRDVPARDIAGISGEIERLSSAVRGGKIARADLGGGTFTVSSIGGVGGLIATPILNAPEVGIVAVGKIVRRPVYDERGRVVPADMAFFSFAFDHRIIDGAVAAEFGNAVARQLAAPATLLLPDEFAA